MSFWSQQRVLVTGGTGFLGGHLVKRLNAMRCEQVAAPPSSEYDLRDHADIVRMYRDIKPTLVIHLAAIVGGIGANRERPGASIEDLVDTVSAAVGFKGRIVWDVTKPNGQPRRKLDTRRAEERFAFQAHTSFDRGLPLTVESYLSIRSASESV